MKYAGEIRLIHVNPETDQFSVLIIFMESSKNPNTNQTAHPGRKKRRYHDRRIEKYFATAENLPETNALTIINLNLPSLLVTHWDEFWRYEGSLTTPPCTQGIIWRIFKTPILFTESELGGFRKNIFFEDYRGPQTLYNRIVYGNFRNKTLSSISDYNCCLKNLDDSNSSFSLDFIQNS